MAGNSVLIVGGGIAGLALQLALHRRGMPSTVVERDPAGNHGGLAVHLTGNAIAALHALGLGAGIERLGRPVRRREYYNDQGRPLATMDEEALWEPGSRPRLVRRSDLIALLADASEGGAARRTATVTSVRPVPDGAMVTFADGHAEEHGLVVGADGVHSVVRPAVSAAPGTRTALLSTASWRGMAPNPGVHCLTGWSGRQSVAMLIPLSDDEVYFYASSVEGGPVGDDPSWLARTFRDFADPIPEVVGTLMAEPSRLYHSPVTEVRIPQWSRGRCVLIGDAAHATAPVWGAGVGLALEDALVLADVLTDREWDAAGHRFEALRRKRVDHITRMTDLTSRGAGSPAWFRRIMLPRTYRATYGPMRRPIELRPLPSRRA